MIRFALLLMTILIFFIAIQLNQLKSRQCLILEHSMYAHMAVEKLEKSYFDMYEALCD
jgi:hypothetical protein